MTGYTFTTTSSTSLCVRVLDTTVNAFYVDDDEEPPTLGVREPRRPIVPALDGAATADLDFERNAA